MEYFFVNFINWAWNWKYFLGVFLAAGFTVQLMGIPKRDRLFSLYMFSSFFLIITTYWILKPLKKAIFISYHKAHSLSFLGTTLDAAQAELLAKELNIAVAFVAMVAYSFSNFAALLIQIFLTSWILKRWGIAVALRSRI